MSGFERLKQDGGAILSGFLTYYAWNMIARSLDMLYQKPHDNNKTLARIIRRTRIPTGDRMNRLISHDIDIDEMLQETSTIHLADIHGELTRRICENGYRISDISYNVGCLNVADYVIPKNDSVQVFDDNAQKIMFPGDRVNWTHFIPFGSIDKLEKFTAETLLLGAIDFLRLINKIKCVPKKERPKYVLGFTGDDFGKTLKMFGAKKITIYENTNFETKVGTGYCFDTEELIANKTKLQRYIRRWHQRAEKYGIDERRARITAIKYLLNE